MVGYTSMRGVASLTAVVLIAAACGAEETSPADTSPAAIRPAPPPVAVSAPGTESSATSAVAPAAPAASAPAPSAMAAVIKAVNWGGNVTVTIDEANDTWTLSSNGRPDHELPDRYLLPKPGVDARTVTLDILQVRGRPNQEVPFTWTLDLTPEVATDATHLFGAVGVASSGAYINDPYEGDQRTIAQEGNFDIGGVKFIDDCNGHFNPFGYHYHAVPVCITDDIDVAGEHSRILGFAADGFPMYGPQGDAGNVVIGLDECRGHVGPTPEFPQGIYHYHLTNEFPYTTLCLVGTVSDSAHRGH